MRGGILVACLFVVGCGASERREEANARGGAGGSANGGSATSGGSTANGGSAASTAGGSGGAGAATNAGSGGASAGSGAAGRPDPGSATELDACLFYVRSVCNRMLYECRGREPVEHPCPEVEHTCPDRYFSEGSNFTTASLMACGDTWQAMSCADVRLGVEPDCLAAGDFAADHACTFSTQCSSLWCSVPVAGDCGRCEEVGGPGEPCSDTLDCDPGLTCDGATCHAPEPQQERQPGESCEGGHLCTQGTACITLPGQSGKTCQRAPRVGEPCALEGGGCLDSYCDASNTCRMLPSAGMPCATGHAGSLLCDSDSYCGGSACLPRAAAGEPCTPDVYDLAPSGTCQAELACHCLDDQCLTGRCVNLRNPGEACTEPEDLCLGSALCRDGVCTADSLRGIYQVDCAPPSVKRRPKISSQADSRTGSSPADSPRAPSVK